MKAKKLVLPSLRVVASLAITFFLYSSTNVAAQGVPPLGAAGAAARRPTLSPYLGMNRITGGPLPAYLAIVRPEQQLRSTLKRQRIAINRQQQRLGRAEQQIRLGSRTDVAPTGVHSGFDRYLHFYPGLSR